MDLNTLITESIGRAVAIGLALSGVVSALTELIKAFGVHGRPLQISSMIVGVALALGLGMPLHILWCDCLIGGILASGAARGLFAASKNAVLLRAQAQSGDPGDAAPGH